GRNGEMMPDGTAGNPHFWWADPTTPIGKDGQAMGGAVRDLRSLAPLLLSSPAPQLPFLGLAIGDPATAIIWSLQDIDNVHAWLEEKLADGEIDLAGVQLRGEFGPVKTTVAYNIPLTGLDLSGGYVGSDYFRFGQYITATWTIDGLYAAAPALQRIVSTAGHPLHLHGYQTETMLGGHVGSATAISVTATIWPLSQVNTRRGELRSQTSGEGLVVVLTDFGTTDFYVGAMEGAMYTANPQVRIATITHQVEPFNVAEGSYLLAQAAREFPPGTVSLAVVDPGVGTERRPIVLETWDEKLFVAPDNGLLTGVMDTLGVAHAYQITNRRLIRPGALSTTFHGRDIYGPVAAHLAAGIEPSEVGPEIPVADLVRLPIASARREGAVLVGSVVHVDWYGNLITNIPGRLAEEAGLASGDSLDITIGEQAITATFVTTYGDVPEGDWLALINAEGVVEIARNLASAAETVRASASTEARLERRD
ncbi:MAG: S-adenosyl-l-methionine hydroxide adenosyltransferase family protein, partial [Anaerolineae bacterium]